MSDGRQFILDPTAEQFGTSSAHRFLPAHVYMEHYVVCERDWRGQMTWTCLDDISEEESESRIPDYWKNAQTMAEACIKNWLNDLRTKNEGRIEEWIDFKAEYKFIEGHILERLKAESAKEQERHMSRMEARKTMFNDSKANIMLLESARMENN